MSVSEDSIEFGIEFPPFAGDGVTESDADTTIYRPWVVDELEEEQDVSGATVRDQCGRTERQNIGTDGKRIRVTGYVRDEQIAEHELTKDQLRSDLYTSATVRMVSNLYSGRIEVQNAVVTQTLERKRDGATDALVFRFQLQLGEPQSEE